MLTQKIIEKEFALYRSEQNPDLTGNGLKLLLARVKPGAPGPVEAFKHPKVGPLIAVRPNILTRKTLGGLEYSGRTAGRAAACAIG